ncbi:MAG: N-acetyltransferase [Elusimicrobia bacterium]|jgi:amino-acid N-acetyltransferase|nr:N-acetyltransferase [Elusimicrobiota bacterium]
MRKATLNDAESIRKLIGLFAADGTMLPRSINYLISNIRDFWVIEEGGDIVGCCALHPLWYNLVEIKSLAVRKDYQNKKLGKKFVENCIDEAKTLGAGQVFTLTYIPGFFEKLGFQKKKKEAMPHKIWAECINCPHFPDCDEVLMVKEI